MRNQIKPFLADTWWYGLTRRLSPSQFESLASLRARQGFTAVQIVVGIPPEVGPENENASSTVGFPWTLDGNVNLRYLEYAKDRVKFLNGLGLTGIIYGAWGHQIDWIGPKKMRQWWLKIIEYMDDLDVLYCLTGESNMWIGQASMLLPAKSTDEIRTTTITAKAFSYIPPFLKDILKIVGKRVWNQILAQKVDKRRGDWDYVLGAVTKATKKPVLIHPTVNETGFEAVLRPELLAANTAQTGHDESSRNRLWQLPLSISEKNPNMKYINLEPWYEGIRDHFMTEDQLFSYWVSMLGGATAYCYGAHGVWNVGDGNFLSHWGKQTFSEAVSFKTPRLIGLSHHELITKSKDKAKRENFYDVQGDQLISIGQKHEGVTIQYFPEISAVPDIPIGNIWLPLQGRYSDLIPPRGQVVIFSN